VFPAPEAVWQMQVAICRKGWRSDGAHGGRW
jgi:hypothetical protein